MKPDWDKLMDEFKDSQNSLVADVDCTTDGKQLCETHGIRGFPTIKYGDPNELKDYSGGRGFDELKKFAEGNLGPSCGPQHLDLCDPEKKAKLEKFMSMSAGKLEGKIRNALNAVEVEVPLLKKVLAHKTAGEGDGKAEL